MRLLRSLARTSASATARALSRHVVPDSLIPSWKTQKRLSSGASLLKKAARKVGKSKSNKPNSTARPSAKTSRPAPKPPKKKFDKNGWAMGRGLSVSSEHMAPESSRPARVAPRLPSRRFQQLKDAVKHPRLVAQMGLDVLKADYQLKKEHFLSNLKHAVKLRKVTK